MRTRVVSFVIDGSPVAKARARIRSGFGRRVFDGQQSLKLKAKMNYKQAFNSDVMFVGPCRLDVTFYMPIGITTHHMPGSYHFIRPDTDNLLKWIMDVSQYILFGNDCCVSEIYARKIFSKEPRTVITIKELEYGKIED